MTEPLSETQERPDPFTQPFDLEGDDRQVVGLGARWIGFVVNDRRSKDAVQVVINGREVDRVPAGTAGGEYVVEKKGKRAELFVQSVGGKRVLGRIEVRFEGQD